MVLGKASAPRLLNFRVDRSVRAAAVADLNHVGHIRRVPIPSKQTILKAPHLTPFLLLRCSGRELAFLLWTLPAILSDWTMHSL